MRIDAAKIKEVLDKVDAELAQAQTICVIGSTATILMGQPQRRTEDIDVWAKASIFDETQMREAATRAGLLFNPIEDEPGLPYIRIVHPGIVQIPGYDPQSNTWLGQPPRTLWTAEKLTVVCPPPEIIIASKMRRFEDRDIADSIWLMAESQIGADAVIEAIRNLPARFREEAEENFSILKHIL